LQGEPAAKLGNRVLSGPFKDTAMPDRADWSLNELPKLLGCYEAELHDAFRTAIDRAPTTVIDVGCAKGYYVVGLARLLPEARVHAFDIDAKSRSICERAAAANGVAARVTVGGECKAQTLSELARLSDNTLVVVDCEGAELSILRPDLAPELAHCDIIVECHDFVDRSITATLEQRFAATHKIDLIVEGPRDPNRFEGVRDWSSIDRWLAVHEHRPEGMHWLAMWSNARTAVPSQRPH
jgi:hypothetical protein